MIAETKGGTEMIHGFEELFGKHTEEELLKIEVCGCADVKKIIDAASAIVATVDEDKSCEISGTLTLLMAGRMAAYLLAYRAITEKGMPSKVSGKLINDFEEVADTIVKGSKEFLKARIRLIAAKNENEEVVPH